MVVSTIRRAGAFVAVIVFAALFLTWPAADTARADVPHAVLADVDDFVFDSLDVRYDLTRADDGTSRVTVVETFVAVFPETDQNRGMRRVIPESFDGVPLHPQLVSITDENGRERAAETDSDDGDYSMTSRADDFVHGTQTYVFTYTLENVVRFYAGTGVNEFYWNVIGAEWRQPFARVTAALHVDPELADAMTGAGACYAGAQGATDPCTITIDTAAGVADANAVHVEPYQAVTVAVAFDEGTFVPFDPSYLASPWGWWQALAGLGSIGGLVAAIAVRARSLRDAPGRPTIIAEYDPPRDIDALESAVLLGATSKAIPAEVLEQAVVGSIRIIEGAPRSFGRRAPLMAELVDPTLADGDGRMLLEGLFPEGRPGDRFEFGRSDRRLSAAAQKILLAAGRELVARGMRRKVPVRNRVWPVLLAMTAGVAAVIFGIGALKAGVTPLWPIVVLVLGVLGTIFVIGLVSRQPLTARGAEVRDHLKGLQVFIEWAEADRIRMLQSPQGAERVPVDTGDPRQMLRLYETLLPYAVVFGQEKEWANQIALIYGSDSPRWYTGSSGFDAAVFSAGISTLSASTASSSSSGGSSGGGSAGGGGGGGGGGGV
ncbi:DUF2207 domain-containing protein [Microbacterium koreense]|uniref:DUF2207 domain-containing protein n=1 Tax=Microbacterium koreense TaxID=323761 RepID=A0ABW2ZPG4_9MICO